MNKNNISYIIAIPSYKRHITIKKQTLAVLEKHKIPSSIIYVFVANKTEEKLYRKSLDNSYQQNITIIVGKKGLKNQRNFISSYFSEMINIVQMDDDIKGIYKLTNYNKKNRRENKLQTINGLDRFIKKAFHNCLATKTYLWGVYPVCNAYFMFEKVTDDLRFITGPFFGIINRHDTQLKLTLDEKEDSQRTLQYYVLDNRVIRYNNITIDTEYYKNKGGMQEEGKDRKKEALKSAHYLIKKYPDLTKLNISKKSGMPEVKLLNKK